MGRSKYDSSFTSEDDTEETETDEEDYEDEDEVKIELRLSKTAAKKSSSDGYLKESGPRISKNGTIDQETLKFIHSYGYDCKQLANICLIDSNTIIFASGNLIHFFNISLKQCTTRRCAYGGGIGHITKNPNPKFNNLTVAENGYKPTILIYQWPSMDVVSVCKRGTLKSFSFIDYTADGLTMASQGCDPDYMITIWNWRKAEVILKCKSFQNDIYKVRFSLYDFRYLATCGQSHIKFWKMCETFTGLKLIGKHGKFGKTEISDIEAMFIMPNEQILSGTLWGNILVWEDSFIRLEVCRKNRKPCHNGAITEIRAGTSPNEIMTIGEDGYICIWFWETVDIADPPDTDPFVEIDPLSEFKIGTIYDDCSLMSVVKMEEEGNWWLAQDSNGAIWKCEISTEYNPKPSELLFRCHGGSVIGIDICPFSNYIATLGEEGRIHIYDYLTKQLHLYRSFSTPGKAIIWLSTKVDPTGCAILLGFADGTIKIVVAIFDKNPDLLPDEHIKLIQTIKPHSAAITKMSINKTETVVVSGSEDKTIFINQLVRKKGQFVSLDPIGYIDIESPATALNWKPESNATLLIGCLFGEILEVEIPEEVQPLINQSYNLAHVIPKKMVFISVKSQIRRDIKLQEIADHKEEKRLKKLLSLERLRLENPDLLIMEEAFLADSSSEEELEPIYIPKIPNRVLWLQYTPDDTIWVSMSGFDAGYIYEYSYTNENPVRNTIIKSGDDIEIHSYLYFKEYLLFGMQDGSIRINKLKEDFRDLSDYWILNMHDNKNGTIADIKLSYDNSYLFSIGNDGNIFQYQWNFPVEAESVESIPINIPIKEVHDIDNPKCPSIEQAKQNENADIRLKQINKAKQKVLDILNNYKVEFNAIINENKLLIESQRYPLSAFELDERVEMNLQESLDNLLDLERQKLAFHVEKTKLREEKVNTFLLSSVDDLAFEVSGIEIPLAVKTFRCQKLCDDFYNYKAIVEQRIADELKRRQAIQFIDTGEVIGEDEGGKAIELYMNQITDSMMNFKISLQFRRLLKKCRNRKLREQQQEDMWKHLYSIEPSRDKNDPADDERIKQALSNVGDYKLKSDETYVPDTDEREVTAKIFLQILEAREEVNNLRTKYNEGVHQLRNKKAQFMLYVAEAYKTLEEIHQELPQDQRQYLKDINAWKKDDDIPEHILKSCNIERKIEPIPAKNQFNYLTLYQEDSGITTLIVNMLLESKDEQNAFERDLLAIRKLERKFQQRAIIETVNEKIQEFDDELAKLYDTCVQIEVDTKFLELHILTLNQELWVYKDFEVVQEGLIRNVEENAAIRNSILSQVTTKKKQIELLNISTVKFKEQEGVIQNQFLANCKNNKFFAFLKRIFQKKFRSTTKTEDGSSSSSSSDVSSSEEEEGEGSQYSQEIGVHAYMDENVCPVGCDPQLYELTFDLRSRRHLIEQNRKKAEDEIDKIKAELIYLEKDLKIKDARVKVETQSLIAFTKEKQQIINKIDTIVILRMDQLSILEENEDLREMKISDTLMFNQDIIKLLYERIGKLKIEALEVQRKHRTDVLHLARIRTDCKFMENQLTELENSQQVAMMGKFGMILDLNELEETLLKNFLNIMNTNIDDVIKDRTAKLSKLKSLLAFRQGELKYAIMGGIEKLNILTVLKEENNQLSAVLLIQEKYIEGKTAEDKAMAEFDQDLNKLRGLSLRLDEKIMKLEKEVLTLRLKAKPFNPIQTQQLEYSVVFPDEDPNVRYCKESIISSESDVADEVDSIKTVDIQYATINKIVFKFIDEQLNGKVTVLKCDEFAYKLCCSYIDIFDRFSKDQTNEITEFITENIKQVIPETYLKLFTVAKIKNLTENVLKLFPETNVDKTEIIAMLIDDAFESVPNPGSRKYSQNVLIEIFKSLLCLRHSFGNWYLDELSTILHLKEKFQPMNINVQKVVEAVLAYANTHQIEHIKRIQVLNFVEAIINKFK